MTTRPKLAQALDFAGRTALAAGGGRPDGCAGAALCLASPLASWVTGTALHVDGGALAASGWYRTPQDEWTDVPLITGNGLVFPDLSK